MKVWELNSCYFNLKVDRWQLTLQLLKEMPRRRGSVDLKVECSFSGDEWCTCESWSLRKPQGGWYHDHLNTSPMLFSISFPLSLCWVQSNLTMQECSNQSSCFQYIPGCFEGWNLWRLLWLLTNVWWVWHTFLKKQLHSNWMTPYIRR